MKLIKKTAVILIAFYLPLQSSAWGVLGHRIVGAVADSYLSEEAKKEIRSLLGNESVAMAGNWMDFIKSDSTYRYLSNWHYVNITGGLTWDAFMKLIEEDTSTNAYTKIRFVANEIKNRSHPSGTRAMYLRILIHLVGDIHQPLHVGRLEDLGGNRIRLSWFNENVNLHQVWDERLINFQQLSYTEYAASINFTSKIQRKTWQSQPLSHWFWESYQYAEQIYGDVKPDDKLGYNYNFKYIGIVNDQLLKGGVRLAGLLNEIFD